MPEAFYGGECCGDRRRRSAVEALQLEVRLKEVLVDLIVELSLDLLSELLVHYWIALVQQCQDDKLKASQDVLLL
jgi:hypothetical protein